MKPFGNKCIVRIDKKYVKEKGKSVLNEDGTPRFEIDQDCTVLASNVDGIKKGMKIVIDFRAGMPYRKLENKKYVVVIIEEQDIHAIC